MTTILGGRRHARGSTRRPATVLYPVRYPIRSRLIRLTTTRSGGLPRCATWPPHSPSISPSGNKSHGGAVPFRGSFAPAVRPSRTRATNPPSYTTRNRPFRRIGPRVAALDVEETRKPQGCGNRWRAAHARTWDPSVRCADGRRDDEQTTNRLTLSPIGQGSQSPRVCAIRHPPSSRAPVPVRSGPVPDGATRSGVTERPWSFQRPTVKSPIQRSTGGYRRGACATSRRFGDAPRRIERW